MNYRNLFHKSHYRETIELFLGEIIRVESEYGHRM